MLESEHYTFNYRATVIWNSLWIDEKIAISREALKKFLTEERKHIGKVTFNEETVPIEIRDIILL